MQLSRWNNEILDPINGSVGGWTSAIVDDGGKAGDVSNYL